MVWHPQAVGSVAGQGHLPSDITPKGHGNPHESDSRFTLPMVNALAKSFCLSFPRDT